MKSQVSLVCQDFSTVKLSLLPHNITYIIHSINLNSLSSIYCVERRVKSFRIFFSASHDPKIPFSYFRHWFCSSSFVFHNFFYELNLMWKNKNPKEERWKKRNVKLSFSERIDIEKRWRTKIFQFTKRSDNSNAISIAAVLSLRNGASFPFLILSCLRCFSFSYFIRVFPFHILHSSNLFFLRHIE